MKIHQPLAKFLASIFIVYSTTYMLWPIPIRYFVVMIICFTACMYALDNKKNFLFNSFALKALLLFFYVYVIVRIFLLPSFLDNGLIGVYQYIIYSFILFCTYYISFNNNVSFIEKLILIFAFADFSLTSYQALAHSSPFQATAEYNGWNPDGDSFFRAAGFSSGAMNNGILLSIYSLIYFNNYLERKNVFFLLGGIWGVICVLCVYSRGPMLAFTFGITTYALLNMSSSIMDVSLKKVLKFGILFILIIGCVYGYFFVSGGVDVLSGRFLSITNFETESSNVSRMFFWMQSINIFTADMYNSIIGIGLGNTGSFRGVLFPTESGILKLLVEGGLVLFILVYSFFFVFIFKMIKAHKIIQNYIYKRRIAMCIAGICIILFENTTLQVLEDISVCFFLFLLMAYGNQQYVEAYSIEQASAGALEKGDGYDK